MNHYKHFREVLDQSTSFYMISTDVHGCYQYLNPAYQAKFGHDVDLLGKSFDVMLHPDDIKIVHEAANKCFENPNKIASATLRKHNGSGGYVVTQWEFRMIEDDSGNFNGFFCIGYDLTEFENEKERNHQLNGILREVVFDQSHLLRSPLSNILGLVNVLKKTRLDENQNNLVNLLEQSSNQLDEVVRAIVNKVYQ